jgi:bifunctional DNA-binding transcriptional regulator/antitoxin component of YhaV-PrlF toxin-antitoxin module
LQLALSIENISLPWSYFTMAIARSKLTAQGQISVPVKVRQKLGIGLGSILEWDEQGEIIPVRRAGRYSSEDIHKKLFPKNSPPPKSIEEMKGGIRRHARKRHARH